MTTMINIKAFIQNSKGRPIEEIFGLVGDSISFSDFEAWVSDRNEERLLENFQQCIF